MLFKGLSLLQSGVSFLYSLMPALQIHQKGTLKILLIQNWNEPDFLEFSLNAIIYYANSNLIWDDLNFDLFYSKNIHVMPLN